MGCQLFRASALCPRYVKRLPGDRSILALLSVLRDGLLRRSEGAALTWGYMELRDNGTALITVRRSKTDPEPEGVTLNSGPQAYGRKV